MTDYEVRPAVKSDSAQIRDLINLVGINPTGLGWRRFLVAVKPLGEVIACGQVKPHGADILELASIAVHPDHRGRGIAREIIARLLARVAATVVSHVPRTQRTDVRKVRVQGAGRGRDASVFPAHRETFYGGESGAPHGRRLMGDEVGVESGL
ncbi:MAG: GNAT family N-acetyltransferase [Chloroflexi bacterium]|nr:GNAT family N-acetyltransferase [Chloroflexota bacterium]